MVQHIDAALPVGVAYVVASNNHTCFNTPSGFFQLGVLLAQNEAHTRVLRSWVSPGDVGPLTYVPETDSAHVQEALELFLDGCFYRW